MQSLIRASKMIEAKTLALNTFDDLFINNKLNFKSSVNKSKAVILYYIVKVMIKF